MSAIHIQIGGAVPPMMTLLKIVLECHFSNHSFIFFQILSIQANKKLSFETKQDLLELYKSFIISIVDGNKWLFRAVLLVYLIYLKKTLYLQSMIKISSFSLKTFNKKKIQRLPKSNVTLNKNKIMESIYFKDSDKYIYSNWPVPLSSKHFPYRNNLLLQILTARCFPLQTTEKCISC